MVCKNLHTGFSVWIISWFEFQLCNSCYNVNNIIESIPIFSKKVLIVPIKSPRDKFFPTTIPSI
jgi:hypothetical protein